MRNLGWATDWCGAIARCRYLGILGGRGGHCLPSSEWFRRSCIQGGPLYITVIRPTIFVVVRMALLDSASGFVCLANWCRRFLGSSPRSDKNRKGKIGYFPTICFKNTNIPT